MARPPRSASSSGISAEAWQIWQPAGALEMPRAEVRLIEPPDEAGCSHARCTSLICWWRQARGVGQLLMLFQISPLNGGCVSAENMKRKLRYPLSASIHSEEHTMNRN